MMRSIAAAVFCALFAVGAFAGPPSTIRGDANGDGATDALDIFYIANHVFAAGPVDSECRADADSDATFSGADDDFLSAYLFAGGPAPTQPTSFQDADGDGYGNAAITYLGCPS